MFFLRAQVVFFLILGFSAHAGEGRCFDFSKKITEPLRKVSILRDVPYPEVTRRSGRVIGNLYWGAIRGRVSRSVDSLVEELEAHETTRSKRISSIFIDPIEEPGFFARQRVHFKVEPFIFITVEWVEDWGFTTLDAAPKAAKSVLVSYEKTEGTSHIHHFCGSIVLTPIDPATTDVFIYQEAEATSQTQEDTLNGVTGMLKTLRNPQNQ